MFASLFKKNVFFCLFVILFGSPLFAKDIRSKALDLGNQYFFVKQISKDFHKKDEKTLLASIGRSDLIFVGKMAQGNVEQSGYIAPLKTDFIMVTFAYLKGRKDFLSVNVTRLQEDVPSKDLKYLAYDSQSMPASQGSGQLYYLGDDKIEGKNVRHSMSIVSMGETVQVTWNIAKIE